MREQAVHTDHEHAAPVFAGCAFVGQALRALQHLIVHAVFRCDAGAKVLLDRAQRKLILAHHLKQTLCRLKAQLRRQIIEFESCFAFALQKLINGLTASRYGFLQRQSIEPSSHLGLGTGAGQVMQLGIEPIARGAALLGGADFNGLPIAQPRVQRNHLAIDARATTAVAKVGVQGIGEIDGSGTLR